MNKKIITISREFGSGGRFIGEEVAKRLQIAFYDKALIAKTAKETGLAKDFIEKKGEYSSTKSIFAYALVGRDSSGASVDDYLFKVQREIILDLAENEPCVIVGRCADFILQDRKDCINIFIYGNEKEKLERIERMYQKSESEARKLIKDMDKKRSINYNYYTEQTWGELHNYTMALNSSELGYDKCIDAIVDMYF